MKCLVFILLIFFNIGLAFAQEKEPTDSIRIPKFEERDESGQFMFQVGTWLPLGNLSKTMGLSPHLGIWFGDMTIPHTNLKLNMGFNLFVPLSSNTSEFKYFLPDTVLIAKPAASGLIGIQISQTQWVQDDYSLDFIAGVGIGFIQTNLKKPKQQNNEDIRYSVDNVYFSLGFHLNKGKVGLKALFNITPLGSFEQTVKKSFGNQSICTGITYKLQF